MRLKSVKNIQKITKSMKMVSAAKFAQAERTLKVARPYGAAVLSNDKNDPASYKPQNLFTYLQSLPLYKTRATSLR